MDKEQQIEQGAVGNSLAKAAAKLIGTPFRLHGRDPKTGLDCIGLVTASLTTIGRPAPHIQGYRLRNLSFDKWIRQAKLTGLSRVSDKLAPGDIILLSPGPSQQHLIIIETQSAFIHAHAGLNRVIRERSDLLTLRPIIQWRLAAD